VANLRPGVELPDAVHDRLGNTQLRTARLIKEALPEVLQLPVGQAVDEVFAPGFFVLVQREKQRRQVHERVFRLRNERGQPVVEHFACPHPTGIPIQVLEELAEFLDDDTRAARQALAIAPQT
jgi:hypothetical protein